MLKTMYNKVREFTNPLNLLIPWLNAIFKKYMGNYFNEEIKKEQFTSMGLKKLTLKVNSLNSQLPPTIPFVLESGSISLLKLDLQKLTCLIEEVEITLNFKNLEQYKEFSQTYQKQQMTAAKLQKLKEEIIRAYKVRSEQSSNQNQNAWNIIRQFLQKITFTVNKLVIHITQPESKEKLSIAINQISMRVRKLQEEKDQMVSTMIIGGFSLHINEQQQLFDINNFEKDSCIFSLQSKYTNKYDQHVVVHLRTELKERLKFNSTLSLQLMQLSFNYQQFQSALQQIINILNHNKLISSQDKVIIESTRQEQQEYSTSWCPKINYNYWDEVNQPNDDQDSKSLSDEPTVEFNDELEDALERSQFNDDEVQENNMFVSQFDDFNQSILNQSNIGDLNQSTLKQSIFSVSVFKELINDEDDQLGLDDLNDPQLIFKLKIQKTKIKLSNQILKDKWNINQIHSSDYFEIELDSISWLMTKELIPSTVTIKSTAIEIPYVQMIHYKYCKETYIESNQQQDDSDELFQSVLDHDNKIYNTQAESNVFHSCYDLSQNDIMEKINKQRQEFLKQNKGQYYKQKTILQIYQGQKKDYELITIEENKVIFQKNEIQQFGSGIQLKLDHLNNTQAITLNKVILTLDFDEILELKKIFTINIPQKPQIKSVPNLNLITIHNLHIDIQIQEADYLDFYYLSEMVKKDPNCNSVLHKEQKISFFTLIINDIQVQQHGAGMITFDQIFCYKKEYERLKQQYHSEIIAEIGLSKNQVRPMIKLVQNNNEIRVAIPLVEIFVNLTYIPYVKSLITVFKNLQKRLKQTNGNQNENQLLLRFLVDELIVKVNLEIQNNQLQTRFILHASKLAGELQGDKRKKITLYNCCVIDQNWNYKKQKYDIPIYGCPQDQDKNYEQPHQMLHFRHAKYQANQVLFYKQERFNREGFKSLIMSEMIKSDQNMGFQYTAIKLKMSQYLNPDCLDAINGTTNLFSILITDNNKFDIILQHGIVQIDEQWIETIQTLQDLVQKWEQTLIIVKSESKPKQIPNFNITTSNIWINYLPTYRKSTLLMNYLVKKEAVKSITAIQAEQSYYSWIRLLVRVSRASISNDLQGHVESASIYVKSTSRDIKHANLSFLNPILLVPPQIGLFQENRKFSDGFQIDRDEQGLLRLLCFQKLLKIIGITFSGKTLNMSKIEGNLKKDSIIGLLDIIQMTLEKINKLIPEKQNTDDQLMLNNNFTLFNSQHQTNIFEDDDIELPPLERVQEEKQFEVILQKVEIKLTIGQHFPPEAFSDSNPLLQEQHSNNEELYYLEHSNIILLEEFPQICVSQDTIYIVMKELKLLCCGSNQKQIDQFYVSLQDFSIVDDIQNSKFSLILGREPRQNDQKFIDAYYRLDSTTKASDIDIKVAKIRVCISGAALEFFLNFINSHEQFSPKLDFLQNLNVQNNRESIIEFCVQEGYQVTFQRPSEIKKPIIIELLSIERISIFITFDGSGVKLDGKLKGLVRLASYDKLEVFLKRAYIQNLTFERQAEFFKFLIDQYLNLVKNDSNLIGNLIVSFKAFQNITNIVYGIQNIFVTIFQQGLIAGLSSGSLPLVKALGDEIVYLAKKPLEMCSTMTEGIGLTVANAVFLPLERALDSISNLTRSDRIPKEFLKNSSDQQIVYQKK